MFLSEQEVLQTAELFVASLQLSGINVRYSVELFVLDVGFRPQTLALELCLNLLLEL